jgi:hypothetical protein
MVKGTITGFDSITTGDDTVKINKDTLSLSALVDRIKTIEKDFDPNTISTLKDIINNHLMDNSNPHNIDTMSINLDVMQAIYNAWLLSGNVGTYKDFEIQIFGVMGESSFDSVIVTNTEVEDLISLHNLDKNAHSNLINSFMPGIPPTSDPVFSFNGFINSILGSYSLSIQKINTIDINGNLSNINGLVGDYTFNDPMYPIYGALSNINTSSEDLSNISLVNTSIRPSSISSLSKYYQLNDNSSTNMFGFTYPFSLSSSNILNLNFMIYPLNSNRYIKVFITDKVSDYFYIDLQEQTIISTCSDFTTYYSFLPNGSIKLGFDYKSTNDITSSVSVISVPSLDSDIYLGTDAPLFIIYGLQQTIIPGLHPLIITNGSQQTIPVNTLNIPISLNSQEGMFVLRFVAFNDTTEKVLLSFDNGLTFVIMNSILTITCPYEDTNLQITTSINTGIETAIAFGYSVDGISILAKNKTLVSLEAYGFTMDNTTLMTIGDTQYPLNGYVGEFTSYNSSDTNGNQLTFLVGAS